MVTVEGVCSGMRRDCWWNPLPNRLRLLSEVEVRGARLSTWVVMLQEVPRLRWYTWTIGHCKAADLELMSLRLGGGQDLFSLRVEVTAK